MILLCAGPAGTTGTQGALSAFVTVHSSKSHLCYTYKHFFFKSPFVFCVNSLKFLRQKRAPGNLQQNAYLQPNTPHFIGSHCYMFLSNIEDI